MTNYNPLDLALLGLIATFTVAFIANIWHTRHQYQKVSVSKSATALTVEVKGYSIEEAGEIIRRELTLMGYPVVTHTTAGAPEGAVRA